MREISFAATEALKHSSYLLCRLLRGSWVPRHSRAPSSPHERESGLCPALSQPPPFLSNTSFSQQRERGWSSSRSHETHEWCVVDSLPANRESVASNTFAERSPKNVPFSAHCRACSLSWSSSVLSARLGLAERSQRQSRSDAGQQNKALCAADEIVLLCIDKRNMVARHCPSTKLRASEPTVRDALCRLSKWFIATNWFCRVILCAAAASSALHSSASHSITWLVAQNGDLSQPDGWQVLQAGCPA